MPSSKPVVTQMVLAKINGPHDKARRHESEKGLVNDRVGRETGQGEGVV